MKTLLLMLLITCSCGLVASDKLLAVTEDLWPLNYVENGSLKGTSAQRVTQALIDSELDYILEVLPWPRAYQTALNRPNTLIFSIVRTPEREDKFQWISQLSGPGVAHLIALTPTQAMLNKPISELVDYRVAALTKSVNATFLAHHGFKNIKTVNSLTQSVSMLIDGRVDFIIGLESAIAKVMEELGRNPQSLVRVKKAFIARSYLAASLNTPKTTINKLKLALESHQ